MCGDYDDGPDMDPRERWQTARNDAPGWSKTFFSGSSRPSMHACDECTRDLLALMEKPPPTRAPPSKGPFR